MTRLLMIAVLAWSAVNGIAAAQDAPPQNTVKLSRVIADLPVGTPYMSMRIGITFCAGDAVIQTWKEGRVAQRISPFQPSFKTGLTAAGYKVVTPGEDNLFDEEAGSADYEVAAVITDEHIEGCISKGGMLTKTNRGDVEGSGSMKVDWQVYSRLRKQVVAHVSTSGTSKLDHAVPGGTQELVIAAFAENVRQLAQNADFHTAMGGARPLANDILLPGKQDKVALAGSLKAAKRPIADAVGSVVTVLTGSGSGSGDLVSSDGYILTNFHVVGDEKQVRVRWSDGIETVAQVVRVAKDRDIALVKTSARDRDPLPIKRGPVTPGARVYAIGSPLGKDYQGTVSSGIISATRVIEGLRYIQSDVSITHGSSGGALLDENGSVIGIAVSGVERGGPLGLNFFIPIGDAMDFLNLDQQ